MLNDWIAPGSQVESHIHCVVDSYLVRLQVDIAAVRCFVYEGGPADGTNIDVWLRYVLDIEALDGKRQYDGAMWDIFNDHILFALVLRCILD
jgi:hypothetical protein